jgi:cell division protein FtsW (lipid II flippase)
MKKPLKVFHWLPRIICILAILFVSLFAADAFSPELTIWQQLGAFIMHLIPSFILIAFLIIAWKWEYIGGIIFIIIGLGLSPFVFVHNYKMNDSIWISLGIILSITIPFVIVGILFMVSHFLKKKNFSKTAIDD